MQKGSYDGVPIDGGYTATIGLMHLLNALNNGGAPGTGIKVLVDESHGLIGPVIPPTLVNYNVAEQNNLFGGYPSESDVPGCIVFMVVFLILGILHLALFIINFSRGHYFWLTLGWVGYCLVRFIGFTMWMEWGKDITNAKLGIASEVFLIVGSIILVTTNLVLAQRLFTWRHPVGGSRKLFWSIMLTLYAVVLIVIAITIVASAVPYVYVLSQSSYESYKKIVMVSAVLILLYTLTAISLIALSYFFKPTTKDENLYTYQPWWIESFHPFYFVRKNAARDAEETFMKRNHNHRHAIRVIAATHHHYNMVEGLTNQRGTLKHNKSLFLIIITTLCVFTTSFCRAVAVFQARINYHGGPTCNSIAAFMCWGLLEVIINVLYLVGRVDLRFYRPDVLPAKVRAIITAEQSYYPSDDEDIIKPTDYAAGSFNSTSTSPPPFEEKQKSHPNLLHFNEKSHYGGHYEGRNDPVNYVKFDNYDTSDNASDFHF